MWGIWIFVILGIAGVALLGMALAVGAAPLFAFLIFLLAGAAIAGAFVLKRGTEHVKDRDAELQGEEASTPRAGRPRTPDGPKPTGRPVTGEGGDAA